MDYINTPISEMGRVVTGKTPSTAVSEYYDGDIMFITPSELHTDFMVEKSEKTITIAGFNSIKNNTIRGISVMVGCIGWDMGNVAVCSETCATNQQINSITDIKPEYNPLYIYYWLKTKKDYLFSMASVTRTPILSKSTFEKILVPMPPKNKQDAITHILSAVDKKIMSNNAVNDNLQQVIKSCFDFMFATRKPNGIINDILQEHPKSTIQVNDSTGVFGDYPFFTSGEAINEWQSALVDGMNCYLSTGGNATIKGYYGKAAYSTDTWCVCGKGEYSFYLFCYLKSIIRSINDSFFAGSGLKHLQKDSLLLVNLYIPSEKELEKFNSIVKPAMETMTKLFLETKKLKQQRDFLLPLLMNGQATIAE